MYKYKKIKLKDGSTIDEHRLVWKEHYGEIPDGMVIHHINGDGRDNKLENLELLQNGKHSSNHMMGNTHRLHSIIPHGTHCGYHHHHCRCDLCRKSHAECVAEYRKRTGKR